MTGNARSSRLFTLRLWREEAAAGRAQWRGKVQSLPDGEAFYFRGWPGLIDRLEDLLASPAAAEISDSAESEGGKS